MLTQPNNEMRNFKRQVLTRVRGLREEREKAADEYASALVNLRSLRARLQVAEHEAQTVRERARKAGNTVAELLAIEELIENSWKDSREPAVSESSEGAASDMRKEMQAASSADDEPVMAAAGGDWPSDGMEGGM